jgi:hypothetical protein
MKVPSLFLVPCAALLLSGAAPAMAAGQVSAAPVGGSPALTSQASASNGSEAGRQRPRLPVDLEHIQREASKQPAVKLDQEQLRFYVLIVAKQPKFADFVGDYDLMYGPTPGGAAMTHKEFLDMVTPTELKELFGGTNANSFALFQAAIMNAAGQFLIKNAIQQIRSAGSERELQEIRQRITRELEALEGRQP